MGFGGPHPHRSSVWQCQEERSLVRVELLVLAFLNYEGVIGEVQSAELADPRTVAVDKEDDRIFMLLCPALLFAATVTRPNSLVRPALRVG